MTYRVPQALSSSSSSNQSYGDASSPSNYQASLHYQVEEQLGNCLQLLPGWKESYDSSGTIVNSSDTIDLLALVEQVIEEDKQRKTQVKEPQIASSDPCFSSSYNDQCVPVQTLTNGLTLVSRECSPGDVQSDEADTCLGAPNANPMLSNLIDGNLMSVYASKESMSGYNFTSRPINSHAISPEQRYYEPSVKNVSQVNVSQHNVLRNLGLNNERSARVLEQNSCTLQDKYTLLHTADTENGYNQPSSTFVPNNYQIPTMVSSYVSKPPQR